MKKIFALATIFMLAAACNQAANNSQTQQPQPQPQPQPQSSLQTYHNLTYGFTLQYPKEWGFVTPTYANLQDKVIQLQLPQSAYPKTNFGDAGVAVSAQFAQTLSQCLNLPAPTSSSQSFKTTKQINGITFYQGSGTGAGAGNFYESRDFRTLTGQHLCIEVDQTLHTANIGNFTPGTVTEVNHDEVFSRMDQILNTFKFDNSTASAGTTPVADTISGISGVAVLGPTCPVQRVGESCTKPYPQARISVLDQSGNQAALFTTDSNGNFKINIKPGTYTLKSAGPAGFPIFRGQSVTVEQGKFTSIQLDFDTGIR